MEYYKITKTQFRDEYNVVKILTDKTSIMKQLKTFNPNNQAVAFAIKKQRRPTIDEKLDLIMNEIKGVKADILKIKTRLDNVVKLNNLKE